MRDVIAAVALLLGATTAAAQEDPLFDRRWESLQAGGYVPLTIPTDWYDPVAQVPGHEQPFELISPADAGVSPAALAAAAAWAKEQNSTALIVARDGKIVYEKYWQSSGRDTRFNPQSMSKSVTGLLVGLALQKGYLQSVHEPIGDYIPQWQDDPRGKITIQQMLWMATGLEQGDDGFGYTVSPENPIVRHSLGSDFTVRLLTLDLIAEPGTKFDYNNQVNQLIALLLENATGEDYETILSEWLWKPLGLRSAAMPFDRQDGMLLSSCCILSRPIDWVRIGEVFNHAGKVGGRAIVNPAWIDEMLKPSPGYAGYGYQIWVGNQNVGGDPRNRPGPAPWQSEPFAAPQMIMLHGHGDQRTYVMPDKGLVIIRAARDWPSAWDDAVLPNTIWRGTEP